MTRDEAITILTTALAPLLSRGECARCCEGTFPRLANDGKGPPIDPPWRPGLAWSARADLWWHDVHAWELAGSQPDARPTWPAPHEWYTTCPVCHGTGQAPPGEEQARVAEALSVIGTPRHRGA